MNATSLFAALLAGVNPNISADAAPNSPWSKDIVYQIFERSFFDSNGDRNGDFKGIAEQLPYIKKLGATAILLQPIFASRFYHNYFADSFTEADPTIGGTDQFFALVKVAHRNHIKVILDMEPQYVANHHLWFIAGPPRVIPQSGIYGRSEVGTYSGARVGLATVNLNDMQNRAELDHDFAFWAAPKSNPSDGVDGFRIDHMMDDLDNTHQNTNLLAGFWAPLEERLRKLKPNIFFVAEQSDWQSLGEPQLGAGQVDAVYAIQLAFAFADSVANGSAELVATALKKEAGATPPEKTQLVFIENHDVVRYATRVAGDPALLRLGAVFQMVTRGTPSIYYGQELGMRGKQIRNQADGNDIPIRLAMPWHPSREAPGTATWYGPGAWADTPEGKLNDPISVEQEVRDPASLLNFYRKLIKLRKSTPCLTLGDQQVLTTDNPSVLAILRSDGKHKILSLLNFSPQPTTVHLPGLDSKSPKNLWTGKPEITAKSNAFPLDPHAFQITQLD